MKLSDQYTTVTPEMDSTENIAEVRRSLSEMERIANGGTVYTAPRGFKGYVWEFVGAWPLLLLVAGLFALFALVGRS